MLRVLYHGAQLELEEVREAPGYRLLEARVDGVRLRVTEVELVQGMEAYRDQRIATLQGQGKGLPEPYGRQESRQDDPLTVHRDGDRPCCTGVVDADGRPVTEDDPAATHRYAVSWWSLGPDRAVEVELILPLKGGHDLREELAAVAVRGTDP